MAGHPKVPASLPGETHDLADVWREIEGSIADRVVFPTMPITDAIAVWPGDRGGHV